MGKNNIYKHFFLIMSSEFLGQGHNVNLLVGMEGGETKDTRVL